MTIAQEGLGQYSQYLLEYRIENKEKFLKIADWLVEHQEENGSYPYGFSFVLKRI